MSDPLYYAEGRYVWKRPVTTKRGTTMGFRVCRLCDGVSADGAEEIAAALNAADSEADTARKDG